MIRLTRQKELIPAPERGPAIRGPQDWDSLPAGFAFECGGEGEAHLDIVLCDGYFYECKVSHQKASNTRPGTGASWSTYWTLGTTLSFVATKILMATYALVENLGVTAIEMKDGQGNVLFEAKNGSVTCKTGNFENVEISGKVTATEGSITGDVVVGNKNGLHMKITPTSTTVTKNGISWTLGAGIKFYNNNTFLGGFDISGSDIAALIHTLACESLTVNTSANVDTYLSTIVNAIGNALEFKYKHSTYAPSGITLQLGISHGKVIFNTDKTNFKTYNEALVGQLYLDNGFLKIK